MNIQTVLHAANALTALHTLDSTAHKKIVRTALGILRRDGHFGAYEALRAHLPQLQTGVCLADPALKAGDDAAKVAVHYDKTARTFAANGQAALAFTYFGTACRAIAEAGLPRASALELFFTLDTTDEYLHKRYSSGSHQRARTGAVAVTDPVDAVRRMQSALHSAQLGTARDACRKQRRETLAATLSSAERVTAGYLLHCYEDTLKSALGEH